MGLEALGLRLGILCLEIQGCPNEACTGVGTCRLRSHLQHYGSFGVRVTRISRSEIQNQVMVNDRPADSYP